MTASSSLSIRLRDDHEHAIVETAKQCTHQRTASKALLRAAELYPHTNARLEKALRELRASRAELETLRAAVAAWITASETETNAREALANLTVNSSASR